MAEMFAFPRFPFSSCPRGAVLAIADFNSLLLLQKHISSHIFFSKHISVRTITLCSFERAGLCDDDAVASGFSKSFAKVWHGVAIRPRRQPRRQPCKHKRVVAPWHDVEVRLYPGWCGRHCCEQQGPELQLHTAF